MNIEDLKTQAIVAIQNAWGRGYKQGAEDCKPSQMPTCNMADFDDKQTAFATGYKKGMDDVWEILKKMVKNEDEGGYSLGQIAEIFGETYLRGITNKYTASEFIEKFRKYEMKQRTDFRIGDEVTLVGQESEGKGVVTMLGERYCYIIFSDGSCGDFKKNEIKRTGKHHDAIAEVLEWLKGEEANA